MPIAPGGLPRHDHAVPAMNASPPSPGTDDADDALEATGFRRLSGGPTDPEGLSGQAALWLARRQDGLTGEEEAEFADWLAGDPARGRKLEQLQRLWQQLDDLAPDDIAALKAALPPVAGHRATTGHPLHRAPPSSGRRLFAKAAPVAITSLALGVAWLGWNHWQQQPLFVEHYATGRGQQLSVTLPEGSALRLDTATRIDVSLHRRQRILQLPQGQALFDVKPDAGRPFLVRAGPVQITVLGTRFSARYTEGGLDAGHTRVVVEEGRVRLARVADAGGPEGRDGKPALDGSGRAGTPVADRGDEAIELTAGQAVVADARGHFGPVTAARQGTDLAWRDGRVVLDDTPLDQAVAEFERYLDTGLVVSDPAVARLRLNGSFDPRQVSAFKRSLVRALPVQLQARSDGRTDIVAAR